MKFIDYKMRTHVENLLNRTLLGKYNFILEDTLCFVD